MNKVNQRTIYLANAAVVDLDQRPVDQWRKVWTWSNQEEEGD